MSKDGFVNLEGIKLHTMDWGGVGKPMVLLTGIGATAKYYGNLAPKLAARFRVVGLTRRGHGRSDRPESGYDLDQFVEDIRGFLDAEGIERTVLVGHSMAGYEMALFAARYPLRVDAIVFLDALYPKVDPKPDLADDPVDALPYIEPTAGDLSSLEAYFSFCKRSRPDWASIWCESLELDLLEKIRIHADGRVEDITDYELFSRIWKDIGSQYAEYANITCPILAIVPAGETHPAVPPGAPDKLRSEANQYWKEKLLPSAREKARVFQQLAPHSLVVELDSSNHRIFMSKEDETVRAIFDFLPA